MARRQPPPNEPDEAPSTDVSTGGQLIASARSGSRLAALRDLRDLLASTITSTDSARDVAALSRQLTDVLEQIDAVVKAAPEQKGSPLDELANRRAERKPTGARRARS